MQSVEACLQRGVTVYDLNGIDPIRNPGVTRFKERTGAVSTEYLHHWEWATSDKVRYLMNLVKYVRDRYQARSKKTKIAAAD
jgi:lipid II:glycine glycyltransferase (peptidoglycan interpeptide bridge formation enzyme)